MVNGKYRKFLLFSLLLLCLLSFIHYSDNIIDYWIIDIFSHFPVQYAFLSLLLFLICIWKRIMPHAILAGFLFVFNISSIVDLNNSIQAAQHPERAFKVYSANINRFNKDFSKLNYELQEIDPDIVLLLEVTPVHFSKLHPIVQTFPYHVEQLSIGTYGFGIALLSKFPILEHRIIKLSEIGNAILEANLEVNQQAVVFYGVHFQSPVFIQKFDKRKKQFLGLAYQINQKTKPVIVAGDFNSTPFSPIFRRFLEISGLRDSRIGFGWQPSWPAFLPFFWLPIDHILVSADFQVYKRSTGSFIGSDHYPVFVELSI